MNPAQRNDSPGTGRVPGDAEQRSLRVRLLIGTALVVATLAAVSVAAIAMRRQGAEVGPLVVSAADQPGSGTAACTRLIAAMPAELGGQTRRELFQPLPAVLAWGNPAIILRCGLPTPAELTCSASLQQVNGVAWLQFSDVGQTSYLAADRSVRIAVTIPDGSGTGELQEISNIVAATLPLRQPCRQGVLLPTDSS